jgi:hypothetical protein
MVSKCMIVASLYRGQSPNLVTVLQDKTIELFFAVCLRWSVANVLQLAND